MENNTKKMCIYIYAAAAKSFQLCPTLCDPIDGSPPGSAIPGILQAIIPRLTLKYKRTQETCGRIIYIYYADCGDSIRDVSYVQTHQMVQIKYV